MSATKQVAEDFDFWAVAGAEFMKDAQAPKRGTVAGEAVAWSFADTVATFSLANLARVLAGMGLTRRLFAVPRMGSPLWYENRLRGAALRAQVGDAPVFVMANDAGTEMAWVCSVSGDWVTMSGGARAEGITGLGAFLWNVGSGEAARRIVRLCGYRSLPRVGDLR